MPFWYHKTDSYRWLTGSIRKDLIPDERGVWADFMAMASLTREPRRGYIERSEGIPYDKPYMLSFLNISEELYDRTVKKCVVEGRLQVFPDGTMFLTNFARYNDTTDYNAKKEARRVGIEKAKRTKSELETLARRGIITQNQLIATAQALAAIAKGVDMEIPLSCAYCAKECDHTVDLARHIYQAKDNKHEPGKGWAKEYLKIGDEE